MSTDVTNTDHGHGGDAGDHGHSSIGFYVLIGAILAVVTGVEVGVFFMEQLDAIEAPLLVALSTAKVILVVMFFMHLKMDDRSLTWIFLMGAVVATFMVSALTVLYHFLPRFGG